jgi:hypothetical protein
MKEKQAEIGLEMKCLLKDKKIKNLTESSEE